MDTPLKNGQFQALFPQGKTMRNRIWHTTVDANGQFSIKRQADNRNTTAQNAPRSQKS